jgi:hypothetical protein
LLIFLPDDIKPSKQIRFSPIAEMFKVVFPACFVIQLPSRQSGMNFAQAGARVPRVTQYKNLLLIALLFQKLAQASNSGSRKTVDPLLAQVLCAGHKRGSLGPDLLVASIFTKPPNYGASVRLCHSLLTYPTFYNWSKRTLEPVTVSLTILRQIRGHTRQLCIIAKWRFKR